MKCPLCHGIHPVVQSSKGKDYSYCAEAHSTLWLTSPIVRRNLGIGPLNGSARSNPAQQDRPVRTWTVYSEGSEEPVVYLEDLE